MLELRCTHVNGTTECGRFLAKLEGNALILRCPLCKGEVRVPLAQLVEHYVMEAKELEKSMSDANGKLLW